MPEILDKQATNWRLKLLEEVSLLPEASLKDMYYLVHGYRLGLHAEAKKDVDLQRSKEMTLSLAGAWQDWDDDEFHAFLDDIYHRRSQSSRRERHEGMLD